MTPQERARMIDEFNQAEYGEEQRQEGVKESIELGRQEDILQNQRQTLIRQLQHKFGDLPPSILAQIDVTEDGAQLETWLDRLLDVNTLDEMEFEQAA